MIIGTVFGCHAIKFRHQPAAFPLHAVWEQPLVDICFSISSVFVILCGCALGLWNPGYSPISFGTQFHSPPLRFARISMYKQLICRSDAHLLAFKHQLTPLYSFHACRLSQLRASINSAGYNYECSTQYYTQFEDGLTMYGQSLRGDKLLRRLLLCGAVTTVGYVLWLLN